MTRREQDLLRLITVLWAEVPHHIRDEMEPRIRQVGLGWALPTGFDPQDDDWLTPDQIAYELGLTVAAIWNWPGRYGIKSVDGRFLWADVQRIRQKQFLATYSGRRAERRVLHDTAALS